MGLSTPQPGAKYGKKDDLGDELVRLAASGIGFFSEIKHHRRSRKQHDQCTGTDTSDENKSFAGTVSQEQPASQDNQALAFNEAVWTLDEAPQETASQTTEKSEVPNTEKPKHLATAFLKRHPQSSISTQQGTLELPVLLTQRRPKTRRRGFVRAYAPILGDVGIDEATFLDFVDTLNESLVPNPWLNAINLAGLATNAIPDPLINTVVGAAIDVTAEVSMELQSRATSNAFLDAINEGFFRPRGLLCLIVTWSPDARETGRQSEASEAGAGPDKNSKVNLNQMIKAVLLQQASSESTQKQFTSQLQHRFTPSNRSFDWLQPAPLVFPPINQKLPLANEPTTGKKAKKKNAFDRAEIWVDHFADKRAQVKWLNKENQDKPNVVLPPAPSFHSRYADPNHPASSGDLLAFVTGGKYVYRKPQPTLSESRSNELASSSKFVENEEANQQPSGHHNGGRAVSEHAVDLPAVDNMSKEESKKLAKMEAEEAREREKAAKKEQKMEKAKQEKFERKMAKNEASRDSWSGIAESTLQQDVLYLLIINDVPMVKGDSDTA